MYDILQCYPSESEDKIRIAEPRALKICLHGLELLKRRGSQLTFKCEALRYIICSVGCIVIQ